MDERARRVIEGLPEHTRYLVKLGMYTLYRSKTDSADYFLETNPRQGCIVSAEGVILRDADLDLSLFEQVITFSISDLKSDLKR